MNQNTFNIENIRLIVGLGNIGRKFINTRHNAGFIFVDELSKHDFSEQAKFEALVSKLIVNDQNILLAKPTTLMNLSGRSVVKLSKYFDIQPEEILLVFDDLDLELGNNKLQFARGPKEHNGVSSVEHMLGTKDFWRYRIGIDSRSKEDRKHIPPNRFVLSKFTPQENEVLLESFSQFSTFVLNGNSTEESSQ